MRARVGKLNCFKREGENERDCVVLLHGFGADAGDLAPLADYLDPDGEKTFYFPDAPLEVPIGPGWTGRGWFPISVRDLELGVDFTQMRPPGLDQSTALVSEMLFEINAERVVLGGFSQGAMVSMDVALAGPEDVNALILYSGSLLDEPGWSAKAAGLKGKRYIQSHGAQDTVLPFAVGQKLNDLLRRAGAEGTFLSFAGAHEIPAPVLNRTREFLKGLG
ncbi:MAG: alpha/beta fold hydrolase [Calothrix sp. SM1_5_4]|nr:alpha/beta fold hydrolase [Calothrix sp. SM1_5_4]